MCLLLQDDRGQAPAARGRERQRAERKSQKTKLIRLQKVAEKRKRENEDSKRKNHPKIQDREKMIKTPKKEDKSWTETNRNRKEGREEPTFDGGILSGDQDSQWERRSLGCWSWHAGR